MCASLLAAGTVEAFTCRLTYSTRSSCAAAVDGKSCADADVDGLAVALCAVEELMSGLCHTTANTVTYSGQCSALIALVGRVVKAERRLLLLLPAVRAMQHFATLDACYGEVLAEVVACCGQSLCVLISMLESHSTELAQVTTQTLESSTDLCALRAQHTSHAHARECITRPLCECARVQAALLVVLSLSCRDAGRAALITCRAYELVVPVCDAPTAFGSLPFLYSMMLLQSLLWQRRYTVLSLQVSIR
jgi:hypothetical protein